MPPIILRVVGNPAPKGSARAMLRGGRAQLVPSGSAPNAAKLASWKTAVTDAWFAAHVGQRHAGPVAIGIIFRLPIRKGDLDKHGGPKPNAPVIVTVKPDYDKLLRSTLDALTSAGAWRDDAQVGIGHEVKLYVPPGEPIGATIIIGPATVTADGDIVTEVESIWRSERALAVQSMLEAILIAADVRAAAKRQRRAA